MSRPKWPHGRRLVIRLFLVLLVAASLGACRTSRAFTSGQSGTPLRVIDTDTGPLNDVADPGGGSTIVGVAYRPETDLLYVRIAPGNRVRVVSHKTGRVIEDITAGGVPAGCGGVNPATDQVVADCGLAIDAFGKRLFLDHPNGNPIFVTDLAGKALGKITLRNPGGSIGGLGFDESTQHLYVLYIPTHTVAEVDLQGVEIRRFKPDRPIQPESLDYDSDRAELLIPLVNGTHLGIFDRDGKLLRQWPLARSGLAGGTGVGSRTSW